jgi:hypothetical protein
MKKTAILALLLFLGFNAYKATAQTVWTGPRIRFEKENGADWKLPENQDRITDNVWITRGDKKSIFNIKVETSDSGGASEGPEPTYTEWAYGKASDYASLIFKPFGSLVGQGNFSNLGRARDMVLHLITDDIYIDLKFTKWEVGSQGNEVTPSGGFAYERSTDPLERPDFERRAKGVVYPNPSSGLLYVSGLIQREKYRIFDITGLQIAQGLVSKNECIDVKNLETGSYFLKFEQGRTILFVKGG